MLNNSCKDTARAVSKMKPTEIGMIPEDWEYGVFSSFVKLRHGFQFLEHHFSLSGIPVIKIGTLKDSGGIDVSKFTFVSEEIFEKFKSIQLYKGDVVMALTGATLGKVSKVDYNDRCLQNYRVGLFIGKEGVDNNFIYHILQSFLVQKTVKELVNSGAQPNLGKADFDKIIIPLPPLSEQEAIATALSDADAWIASLEQIIAKKRLIKQGAMQTLLTPKEDWEVKKLGEVVNIVKGQQFNSELLSNKGYYPCYSGGINPSGYSDKFNEKENTIIISEGGNSCGFVNYMKTKFWLGGHCYKIVFKTSFLENLFTYQLLKYNQDKIMALRVGSGLPNIQKKSLEDFAIKFPSLSEQERIATVLSDMDAELEALENQLAKARQIKQGMMQELLTGRIRLI